MIHRIFTVAFFLVLLVSWEVASRSGLWSPVLLPSPLNVLEYMWQATMDGTLVTSTMVTMKRLLLGYGIGLLIEVLTGVIAGGAFGEQVVSWVLEDPTPVNQSHSFLAIDVSHYLDATDFRNRMDELVRFIRNAPRAKGAERIYLPGELEWDARVAALEHGMMLPDHVMVRLEGLSLDTGIPLETIYG